MRAEDLRGDGNSVGQVRVRSGNRLVVTGRVVVCRQSDFVAGVVMHWFTVLEQTGTDFRTFSILQNRAHDAGVLTRLTKVVQSLLVVLVRTVRKVEPRDGHASL